MKKDIALDTEMSDLAKNCKSLDSYHKISKQLFVDGVVSYGRLVALTLFTQKVCYQSPNIANEIKNHYIKTIIAIRLCPNNSKEHRSRPRNGV
jgi:hypothetical protein